jgi:hypothetical protein
MDKLSLGYHLMLHLDGTVFFFFHLKTGEMILSTFNQAELSQTILFSLRNSSGFQLEHSTHIPYQGYLYVS